MGNDGLVGKDGTSMMDCERGMCNQVEKMER